MNSSYKSFIIWSLVQKRRIVSMPRCTSTDGNSPHAAMAGMVLLRM